MIMIFAVVVLASIRRKLGIPVPRRSFKGKTGAGTVADL